MRFRLGCSCKGEPMANVNPKAVASEFRKVIRSCRGVRPNVVEPGTAVAARLKARHGIDVTKTLDVPAEISRLMASGQKSEAAKLDAAVRREWCHVNLGSPTCDTNISEVAAVLIEAGKAGLDGLPFSVTCPKCGCVSEHRIAIAV